MRADRRALHRQGRGAVRGAFGLQRHARRPVHRRRVPVRLKPDSGDRALRGCGADVFVRAALRLHRRRKMARTAGACGLQRPARRVQRRHVGAPVCADEQPDGLRDLPGQIGVPHQRPGRAPVRAGAELRLLHGQLRAGLAQAGAVRFPASGRHGGQRRMPALRASGRRSPYRPRHGLPV